MINQMTKIYLPYHSILFTQRDIYDYDETISPAKVKDIIDTRYLFDAYHENLIEELIIARLAVGNRVICLNYKNDLFINKLKNLGIRIFIDDNISDYIEIHDQSNFKIRENYRGITVLGDVHGELDQLKNAVKWAESRNNYMIFLGDIIDYGSKSLETVEFVYELVMNGKASMLIGNHERKILKWITNKENGVKNIKLSEGNKVTSKALLNLSETERKLWITKFKALIGRCEIIKEIDGFVLVHGAVHPTYWERTAYDGPLKISEKIENYALFGEYDSRSGFKMIYNWISHIPKYYTVIVGHDTRSTLKPINMNSNGSGNAIFLDTGCGKNGVLTTADLCFFEDRRTILQNYFSHNLKS